MTKDELTKAEMTTKRGSRRADWINRESMGIVLAALMPQNRLAVEVAMRTGLRISDVLNLKTAQIEGDVRRISVRELKTGKNRRIYLPDELRERMMRIAGRVYVFEGRTDRRKHRTRQAVAKDLMRARKILRAGDVVVSSHTARKIWAVEEYHKKKEMEQLQKKMNHSDPAITLVYSMADEITRKRFGL